MDLRSNTILITGGNSGIGRGLAEALARLGNRVIIGGRNEAALREVAKTNPGIEYVVMDVRRAGHRVNAPAQHVQSGSARLVTSRNKSEVRVDGVHAQATQTVRVHCLPGCFPPAGSTFGKSGCPWPS